MSFAKSPSQVRSGINTAPSIPRSLSGSEHAVGEVRLPVDEKTLTSIDNKPSSQDPPTWICILSGMSSATNLTAFVVLLHNWHAALGQKTNAATPAWQMASAVGNLELSAVVMALFAAGVVLLILVCLWAFFHYKKMKAYGVWILLFMAIMMYDFAFALFLRLTAGATKEENGQINLDEKKSKTAWFIFLATGGLATGLAASAAVRVKVWKPMVFGKVAKWAMKFILGLSILVYGTAPFVGISSSNLSLGFWLSMTSFTVVKLAILVTMVGNRIGGKNIWAKSEERTGLLAVDQDTETH